MKNKIIILLTLVITGCTTIGQQIVNRDGVIQIKQENTKTTANTGQTHDNSLPAVKQPKVYQTTPRITNINTRVSIMQPNSTWPAPPSTIVQPAPLPPVVDTVTTTTVYSKTVPTVVRSVTTNTAVTRYFILK